MRNYNKIPPVDFDAGERYEEVFHRLPVVIEFYIPHSPGSDEHLREMVESYLRGKGVPTVQDGKQSIVIKINP